LTQPYSKKKKLFVEVSRKQRPQQELELSGLHTTEIEHSAPALSVCEFRGQ